MSVLLSWCRRRLAIMLIVVTTGALVGVACDSHPNAVSLCGGSTLVLARDADVNVSLGDINRLRSRAAVSGTSLEPDVALFDVIWQTHLAQNLDDVSDETPLEVRRRLAIGSQRHAAFGGDRTVAANIRAHKLPPDAALTRCGEAFLIAVDIGAYP